MPEVYTCICGGQSWTIYGAEIKCGSCGRCHGLNWLDDEVESPADFNRRIRPMGVVTKDIVDDSKTNSGG